MINPIQHGQFFVDLYISLQFSLTQFQVMTLQNFHVQGS